MATPHAIPLKHGYKGFTLLEISIVLIIFSVMVGSGFAIANRQDEQKKRAITAEHLNKVEEALMAYRSGNNRLPCPADASMNPDNAQYGIEAANPDPNTGTCTGGSPAANFTAAVHPNLLDESGNPQATFVVGGMVPVSTLGLPKKYALDGYGNKISYHIDAQATEQSAFSHYTSSSGKCFNVVIDDEKTWAANADKSFISLNAVYALVSHGKDGHGAFAQGGARVNKSSTNAFQNANGFMDSAGASTTYTSLFFLLPESESPTDATNRFDDMVRFKTRMDLQTAQDSPALVFPDLAAVSTGGSDYGSHFYYRCKDRFIMDQSELIDDRNRRIYSYAFSPNNELIAAATSPKHFEIWTYDGIKTTLLPDSAFSPRTSGGAQTIYWASDATFFLVSSLDSVTDLTGCNTAGGCNRIRVYTRTGPRSFTSVDKPIENANIYYTNAYPGGPTANDRVLSVGSLITALSPDNQQLVLANNDNAGAQPMLYKRNSDNTFSHVPDAFDPPPPIITTRWPKWSPDMHYLMFPGQSSTSAHGPAEVLMYRNDGNYHYSQIPNPGAVTSATQPLVESHNNTSGSAYTIAFSPNSKFLATGSKSAGWFKIFELKGNDVWERVPPANITGSTTYLDATTKYFVGSGGAATRIGALAWSRDGRYLAVGLENIATPAKRLHIFKVEGNKFTLLENEVVSGITVKRGTIPDIAAVAGNRGVHALEWRQLMPWEQ